MMEYRRLYYIDFLRGLAMLLVLYGHSSAMNLANKTLNTFHMPLFFFVSGLCFSLGRGEYYSYIKKKFKGIIIPQITLGILLIVEQIVFDVLVSKRFAISEVDFLSGFLWWFLLVLFFDYAILYWITKLAKNNRIVIGVIGLFALSFCIMSYNEITYFQQTLLALIFSIAGYLSRPFIDNYDSITNKSFKGSGWLLYLVIAISMLLLEPVFMYNNQYGFKPVFLLLASMGILASIDIACSLKPQVFLSWIGKNSITIYITQFFLLRLVKAILVRLPASLIFLNNGLVVFLVVILLEIGVVKFVNKYFPFIIGKSYK